MPYNGFILLHFHSGSFSEQDPGDESELSHNAGENLIAPPTHHRDGLASWCVAVGPREREGSEETPPTCRIAPFGEGESLGNGAETTRPPGLGDEARVVSSVLGGSGETAVLHVERANSR